MRAACAAKCAPSGYLERLVSDPKGSLVDFLLQDVLPLVKPVIDELCDQDPGKRSALLALWLLERAGAPAEPVADLKTWSKTSSPVAVDRSNLEVRPPLKSKPGSDADSPRKKASLRTLDVDPVIMSDDPLERASIGCSSEEVDSANRKASGDSCLKLRSSSKGGLSRKPSFQSSGMSVATASPGRSDSKPSNDGDNGTRGRRVSIWQCTNPENKGQDSSSSSSSGSLASSNAPSDAEDGGAEEDAPPAPKSARARASLAQGINRASIVPQVNAGNRRRRFTVNLSKMTLELPDVSRILALLRAVPSFALFSEEDLRKVASIAKCNKYEVNEPLVSHGCVADQLHVIMEGCGKVSVPYPVGTVEPGDCFGEEALALASATSENEVSAVNGPVVAISISATDFHKLDLKRPTLAKKRTSKIARKRQNAAIANGKIPSHGGMRKTCLDCGRPIIQGATQTLADKQMVVSALKNNKMLGEVLSLTDLQCNLAADSMYQVTIQAEETLWKPGATGQALYIVQEGLLETTCKENGKVTVTRQRSGDIFGELALLYDVPRAAKTIAIKNSVLWVLGREDFKLVATLSYKDRLADYSRIVGSIPFLANLVDPQNLDLLADALEEITVLEGEDLCVQGEDAGFLYIIYQGECEVLKDKQLTGRSLVSGDWIGEQQLLKGHGAEFTVRATAEIVTALVLDYNNMTTVVKALTELQKEAPVEISRTRASIAASNAYHDHVDREKFADEYLVKKMFKAKWKYLDKKTGGLANIVVKWTELNRLGILGEGSFGSVLLMRDEGGCHYALKALSKNHITKENMGSCVQNERSVMMLLDSDFIVRLHCSLQDSDHIIFLLEPVLGGELFDVYNDHQLFGNLDIAKFYYGCIATGLQHMHDRRVIYRDLKLENCLLDTSGYVKLTDMGIAKIVVGKTYTVCGTADYFAPEVLRQTGHNRAADWWTSGVVLFIMITGQSPFDAPEVTQIYKNIIKGFSKVKFPENVPSDATDVIKSLCRKVPEERVPMQKGGFDLLKAMPFFISLNWEALQDRSLAAPFAPPAFDMEKIVNKKLTKGLEINMANVQVWDGSLPEK